MKSKLIVMGSVALLLLVTVFYLLTRESGVGTETIQLTKEPLYPSLFVTSPGVFITDSAGERPVASGEKPKPPYTLRGDATGKAVVHFDDGSELRLDSSSTLEVRDASLHTETKALLVKVKLTVGRVWSDIVALATPESAWEVETSNVVATVRGTAFGVITEANGTTTVIGSEHTVELTLIDPETGERNTFRRTPLSEDEFIIITNALAKKDSSLNLIPSKKTEKELKDPWVLQNEKKNDIDMSDTDLPSRVDTGTGTGSALPHTSTISNPRVDVETTSVSPTGGEAPKPVSSSRSSTESKKAASLVITPSLPLDEIVEDTRVPLTATLTYSDQTTENVNAKVFWNVIGKIGYVEGNVFVAKLDPSVSELGHAPGSITATWKDGSGDQILGSTPIFDVQAKVVMLEEQG
jgi:hypothetical protein